VYDPHLPDIHTTATAVVKATGYEMKHDKDTASQIETTFTPTDEYIALFAATRDVAGVNTGMREPAPVGHTPATATTDPYPSEDVAQLTRQMYRCMEHPECYDTHRLFQPMDFTPEVPTDRLREGNVCVGPDYNRSVSTNQPGLLGLYSRNGFAAIGLPADDNNCPYPMLLTMGGDMCEAVNEASYEGVPCLRVQTSADNQTPKWLIYRTGTATFHASMNDMFVNRTVYRHGGWAALSVVGALPAVDPGGILRHRLLYEGAGHFARGVPWNCANTHYVVYWHTDSDTRCPVIFLHVRKPIEPYGEVTRPVHLESPTTVHMNAGTGVRIRRDDRHHSAPSV
jgi:hypothetical protein